MATKKSTKKPPAKKAAGKKAALKEAAQGAESALAAAGIHPPPCNEPDEEEYFDVFLNRTMCRLRRS